MEIKYELHLGNLHVQKDVNGIKDVVVAIEYTYSGSTVIDGLRYAHGITKAAVVMKNVDDVNNDNIIDFNDITKEMALSWVQDSFTETDIISMNNAIRGFIENETKYASKTPPWLTVNQPIPEIISEEPKDKE